MNIHVLIQKEAVDEEKVQEGDKVAVVLDILLATTTITSALHHGAKEVRAVASPDEGRKVAESYAEGTYVLAGEEKARPIEGFSYPSPTEIASVIKGKTLILSTTNGTVALRKVAKAKSVYVASLLNMPAVARQLKKEQREATLLIVCAGNSGELSLEDFYGAGCLIHLLAEVTETMNDTAKAAHELYLQTKESAYDLLASAHIGQFLTKHGLYEDLAFSSRFGVIDDVYQLHEECVTVLEKER
ncbi:2-phosphosulfolactate phosphatase [Shouchella shacheensis]|uniref:2-phosphosulfolactate phosphatase n=1 Tax=Shouchella shacheensis TaxID=1649580 RepID=UPI00074017B1|nr:2-phosphosulfolactate phosphatase [Shouchella shacheensis]